MPKPTRTLLRDARVFAPSGRIEHASVLVAGDRIEAVLPRGGDDGLAGRDDVTVVELAGRTVIPGFVDAHIHLSAIALKQTRCDLAGTRSADEAVARLCAFAAAHPGAGAVVGVDWDESAWNAPGLLTRDVLDSVGSDRPVYARRVCGHVGVVNGALLAVLDVPPRFVDGVTGRITEDGVFAANRATAPDPVRLTRAMEGAIRSLHALGVTAVHDVVTLRTLDAYLDGVLGSRAPLSVDVLLVGGVDDLRQLHGRLDVRGAGERVRAAGIKLFADGSLGGHTAALHEPYADADTRGELLLDDARLRAEVEASAREGAACAVHAIGDRAVAAVLAAAQSARGAGLVRVEHAEVLGEGEVTAARRSGATLVMQPNFVRNWQGETGLYRARLGEARWRRTNPFRTLESAGVNVVFGSDGMPPGPLFGLRGALRHPVPGESIDVVSALRRYTELPHRAVPDPRPAGRIAPGYRADLAVLSGNPVLADTDTVEVVGTWVGGEEVYRRGEGKASRNPLS